MILTITILSGIAFLINWLVSIVDDKNAGATAWINSIVWLAILTISSWYFYIALGIIFLSIGVILVSASLAYNESK